MGATAESVASFRETATPTRQVWAATDVGLLRNKNQDRWAVSGHIGQASNGSWNGTVGVADSWALIADGMGGMPAGEIASEIAVRAMAERLATANTSSLIASSIDQTNQIIFETIDRNPSLHGMGTTIVGARFVEGGVYLFNVGDSRAYLLEPQGLSQKSHDDSLQTTAGQKRSHVLTQCLGGWEYETLSPHIVFVPLYGNETILLCSDGLTDMLLDAEISSILSGCWRDSAQALTSAAVRAGGVDNVTTIACS